MRVKKEKTIRVGPVGQKILLLLFGGIALGLSGSPARYFRIVREIEKEWGRINKRALHDAIKKLYSSKLVDGKENRDGSWTMVLTDEGKEKALTYKLREIKIAPMETWDGKWRIIIFDIPEHLKKARDALASTLKNMGFYRLQKSVFVHPFECKDEVDFVIEFFQLRPYVRAVIAEQIDNELHLKKKFGLLK